MTTINPCWLPQYRLALYYADIYNREHKYDLVHDAWINHYKNYQEDLFDKEHYPSFLYRAIKWSHSHWTTSEFRKSGRYYFGIDPEIIQVTDDPLQHLIASDIYNQFYIRLVNATQSGTGNTELAVNTLKLLSQGYGQTDIAKILNESKELIHSYVTKIRQMAWLNPFNGNKLVVKKVISEGQWERRVDRDDFELDDDNEFYALYQHKESKEGLLIRLNELSVKSNTRGRTNRL